MVHEQARVTAIEGDYAWVQTQRQSACQSCSAQKGCGTSTIGKVIGQKYTQVKALNHCDAQVGDWVSVSLSESMLLKSSMAVYLLPLVLILSFAAGAEQLMLMLGLNMFTQWAAPIGALCGGLLGFLWLKWYSVRVSKNASFQPVCEKVIQSADFQLKATYTP